MVVKALNRNAEARETCIIAYCIMPDHLHIVACNGREGEDIRDFVKGLKLTTSRLFREAGVEPLYWQRSYWDKHARRCGDLAAQVEYVLMNPVTKGLCADPEDWPYSEFRGWPGD